MICQFHRRGDPVPLNWYTMTAFEYGQPKFGKLRFGSDAISRIEDGKRILVAARSPALVVSDCGDVSISFGTELCIDIMNG